MKRVLMLSLLLAGPFLMAREPAKRAFIGVQIAAPRDKETTGFLVQVVIDRSPAAKGGLKGGDILLRIDGVKPADLRTAVRIIQALKPGKKTKFLVRRGEKEIVVEIVPVVL